MSYNRRLFCCNGYSGKAPFIGRTTMKKISAILFSIILAVIMTVTNMAGTYHSALRVYAAEINEDAQEQDTPDNPLEGTQNPEDADTAPIGAEGEKEKAPEAATDEVETQTAIDIAVVL